MEEKIETKKEKVAKPTYNTLTIEYDAGQDKAVRKFIESYRVFNPAANLKIMENKE